MTTNPEVQSNVPQSPEVKQVIESAKAGEEALKQEVATISGTRTELGFFDRLGEVWKEIKEGNISKAIAILFGTKQQESQQSSASTTNASKEQSSTSTTNTVAESKENEPKDTDLVSVEKYISSIKSDMRYATTNNFTGEKVYDSAEAKLRYGTVKKLAKAQEALQKQGYSIKIWDAYRPQSVQEKFKKIVKDRSLVASKSDHTRGSTVDVTLVKSDGTEVPMPSKFDDFDNKNKCKSDFSAVSGENKKNGQILQKAMKDAGFTTIKSERWHFNDEEKLKYDYIN